MASDFYLFEYKRFFITFFFFLLGASLAFVVTLGVLGWSLPAFLALGAVLPFGFLIAPALLLGSGLLFAIVGYVLSAEKSVEETFLAELQRKDYQDMDAEEVVDDLLASSDVYVMSGHLTLAQDIVLGIVESQNEKDKAKSEKKAPETAEEGGSNVVVQAVSVKLRPVMSTLSKEKAVRTLNSVFKKRLVSQDQKASSGGGLSLREKYTPSEQIDRLLSLQPHAEEKFAAELSVARDEQPVSALTGLDHWLKAVHLTHQVAQHQQQRHVAVQEVKIDAVLDAKVQQALVVDAAAHLSYDTSYAALKEAKKNFTANWLEEVRKRIFAAHQIKLDTPFSIAPEALEVLLKGNDYVSNSSLIDLEKLAVGLVLVHNQQGGISLIYQAPDSKKQEFEDGLMMDYAGDILEDKGRNLYGISLGAIHAEYEKKRGDPLKPAEKDFLDQLVSNPALNDSNRVKVIHVLIMVADKLNEENLLQVIAALADCGKREFIGADGKKKNLLAVVSSSFNKAQFNNPKAVQALVLLAKCSGAELRWFDALTSFYPAVFEDVAKGFFYFINFFKVQGIPLPDKVEVIKNKFRESSFGILTKLLDCISLSKAKKLQSAFITELPADTMLAKAQLRAGYSVVHRGMCFDPCPPSWDKKFEDFFQDLPDPFIISAGDLEAITYHPSEISLIFYRALFLRYVAVNGDGEDFVKALEVWKSVTGEDLYSCLSELEERLDRMESSQRAGARERYLKALDDKLKQGWPQLKAHLLALNKRLEAKAQDPGDPVWLVRGGQNPSDDKRYKMDDAEKLFKKLGIAEADQKQLREDVELLSGAVGSFPKTDTEFRAAIREAADRLRREKGDNKALLQCLALMREAHYRLKRAKKNDDKKQVQSEEQGEWLRLEQVLVILLALRKDTLFQIDTSEGKTLMLQLIALLKALQGTQGDVLTHNESLAVESADSLRPLANLFGIKIAKKTDTPMQVVEADILYIDIATAVINRKLAQFEEKESDESKEEKEATSNASEKILPGQRKAKFALVDEVDNVTIDIHADTTMQISQASDSADQELEEFLIELNQLIRQKLPEQIASEQYLSKEDQRQFIQERLREKKVAYYEKYCEGADNIRLDFWISAAVTAAYLKEKEDYVIETEEFTRLDADPGSEDRKELDPSLAYEVVHIIHKTTTGRVDKVSQWGSGVHQCVTAWEKVKGHPKMKIPGISKVIAEGDVSHHLQRYDSRCGFTGTLGEAAVRRKIERVLGTQATVVMPRAKKGEAGEISWPKVPVKIEERKVAGESESRYTRRYDFPPQFYDIQQEHRAALLAAVRSIQEQNLSGVLFFNTVKECEAFADFLTANGVGFENLQILDDTHPDAKHDEEESKLRPSEEMVRENARRKRMITLTTAAGGRGLDFREIDVAIATKPSLKRVLVQKLGRVGRNKDLGVTYEIYCKEDLGYDPAKVEVSPEDAPLDSNPFRFFMKPYEDKKQAQDLATIDARADLHDFKQDIQDKFVQYRSTKKPDERGALNAGWANFFGEIDLYWQAKDEGRLEEFAKKCFQGAESEIMLGFIQEARIRALGTHESKRHPS